MTPAPEPSDRARADARRAAQAARLARRARNAPGTVPADPEVAPDAEAEVPTTRPSLAKAPADVEPAVVEPEVVEPAGDDAAVEADAEVEAAATTPAPKVAKVAKPAPKVAKPVAKVAPAEAEAEAEDDDASDDDDEDADDRSTRVRRRPRRATVLSGVFALVAAIFLVISAVVHANAQDTRSTSPTAARDAALLAARQDIVVLNTLDYKDVDGGLSRWADATTGTLHDQLTAISDADKQVLAVSKSVTTASVLAAAVTQVDANRGAATVIASVQIVVTPDGGKATAKRNRFSLTMAEVGEVWKIGAVQQVPVTVS